MIEKQIERGLTHISEQKNSKILIFRRAPADAAGGGAAGGARADAEQPEDARPPAAGAAPSRAAFGADASICG